MLACEQLFFGITFFLSEKKLMKFSLIFIDNSTKTIFLRKILFDFPGSTIEVFPGQPDMMIVIFMGTINYSKLVEPLISTSVSS